MNSITRFCLALIFTKAGHLLMAQINPEYIYSKTGVQGVPPSFKVPVGKINSRGEERYRDAMMRILNNEAGIVNVTLAPFDYTSFENKEYYYWIGKLNQNIDTLVIAVDTENKLNKTLSWSFVDPLTVNELNVIKGLLPIWNTILEFIKTIRSDPKLLPLESREKWDYLFLRNGQA